MLMVPLKNGIKMIYGMEGMLVDDGVPIAYKPTDRDLKEATYVVFDVETTGLSNQYDQIIELAAVKVKDGKLLINLNDSVILTKNYQKQSLI